MRTKQRPSEYLPAAGARAVRSETSGAQANGYVYRTFDSTTRYTIQSGDTLEFDVFLDSSNPQLVGGFDALLSTSGTVRDHSEWVDQNGKSIHPSSVMAESYRGEWYHRVFQIGNKAGETLSNFKIVHEGNSAGFYIIRLDNIQIKNNGVVKKVIYSGGFAAADMALRQTSSITAHYLRQLIIWPAASVLPCERTACSPRY